LSVHWEVEYEAHHIRRRIFDRPLSGTWHGPDHAEASQGHRVFSQRSILIGTSSSFRVPYRAFNQVLTKAEVPRVRAIFGKGFSLALGSFLSKVVLNYRLLK
jgi:hypothetical protein